MRSASCLALIALLCACSSASESPGRRNLLLISLDSTRADHVGAYGHRSVHAPGEPSTPNLDRLAEQGVLFETALATTSWTLPSHVSIFTGTPELVHGVELDGLRLGARHAPLAELLSRAGYRTAGFFSGPYLEPRFGFDRGFERYEACYGEELTRARLARDAGGPEAERALEIASHRDVSSPSVLAAALAELEEAAGEVRPFFLFVHLFDPHYDYLPPAPFDRFDPGYTGSIDGSDFYRNPAISTFDASTPSGRRRTVSDRDLEHVQALYSGDLAATDAALGRLLERLDQLELTETTVVVVVGDHGDEFFEHGGIGHRRTLYEEVLRVPLVVRAPGALPEGERVTTPVSTAAVAPTVLELLGISAPATMTSPSLVPLVRGESAPTGVLSRLVTRGPARLTVEVDGRPTKVAVRLIQVQETFRLGSIKVTRERTWTVPKKDTATDLLPALKVDAHRRRAEERLTWIDLALHPSERDQDHSTDFADRRARVALEAFRERYLALSAQRHEAVQQGERDDGAEALLRGLGYGGSDAEGSESDDLLLPPPGEGVL